MFRTSTANHQEVRCMYVANGTSKMTASERGWNGIPFHPGSLTFNSEVLQVHLPHIYILPPGDGLLMPETCSDILIQ
jgi:hypothetical protein